tara:strand:+ start:14804 stop:15511 length:708 start_codon:yes stop_codon:yes gene_type:complete
MNNLALFGKKYMDTILFVDCVKSGETNECHTVIENIGGLNNFYEARFEEWEIMPIFSGSKKAYIVSDKLLSKRTSYVFKQTESTVSSNQINSIQNNNEWLHVCYIDDIECYSQISNIKIPYSLDFCTDKDRDAYFYIINNAKIVFDSRERKHLYKNMFVSTPLILHDECGFEIIKNGVVVHEQRNIPLSNLNVNGAGDLFAAFFIKHYKSLGLIESSKKAMVEATKTLIKRKKNE